MGNRSETRPWEKCECSEGQRSGRPGYPGRPRPWTPADPSIAALGGAVVPYPSWLSPGDNAWQLTAATLVGLMSIPALAVLRRPGAAQMGDEHRVDGVQR